MDRIMAMVLESFKEKETVEVVGKLTPEEWAQVEAKDKELDEGKERITEIIKAEYDKKKEQMHKEMLAFTDDLREKEMPPLEASAAEGIEILTKIVNGHGFDLKDIKIDGDTGEIVRVLK